jgi:hypothetical protein
MMGTGKRDLAGAAGHLRYELDMLRATCRALQSGFFPPGVLHNALIESFTVHARNLVHFLYPEGEKESDILSDDFLSDPGVWQSARGDIPASLIQVRRRANKEVAHLTIDRLAVTAEAKPWDCPGIVAAITERFELWEQLVPPECLNSGHQQEG